MTITADSAASNGRLRASSDTQPPALRRRAAPGAGSAVWRSSAAGTRAGAADGRARSEAALSGRDARLMMLQRPLWSLLCDHYFRLEVSGLGAPAGADVTVGGRALGWGVDDGCVDAGRGVVPAFR